MFVQNTSKMFHPEEIFRWSKKETLPLMLLAKNGAIVWRIEFSSCVLDILFDNKSSYRHTFLELKLRPYSMLYFTNL